MAYLSTNFPGEFYGGDYAKSFDFSGFFDNQKQKQEAFQNQELNRQMALEDIFHTRQMNPLRVENQQQDLARKRAELPGIEAEVATKVERKKLDDAVPFETRRMNLLTKLAKETNEAELANEKAQIERFILNPTTPPQVRQQLIEARNFMNDLYKHRLTLDSREAVAEKRAAPRMVAPALPKPPAPPKTLEELEARYRASGDLESAELIKQQIKERIQDKATAAGTGKVDIEAVTNGAVKVRPGIPPGTPAPAVAGRPERQQATQTPKAPAGRVVIYKDGKPVGSVPESQKAMAIQQGYTVK